MIALAPGSEGHSPPVNVRLPTQKLAYIDEIAARNNLTRSVVIRMLIDRGLKAARDDLKQRQSTDHLERC